jgi:hypothetical protein
MKTMEASTVARRLAHVRVSSSALLVGGMELEGCGDGGG